MASKTDAATQRGLDTPEPREPWFAQDADRVVAAMETDAERGLSRSEAAPGCPGTGRTRSQPRSRHRCGRSRCSSSATR